jgi:lysozyme
MKKQSSKTKGKSKKSLINWWTWMTFFAACITFLAFIWAGNNYQQLRRIKNRLFHVSHHEIPPGYEIHGIDISRYQGRINWKALADNRLKGKSISFVFIKSTEGATLRDSHFERNWKEATNTGIKKGAYHYFKPRTDPREQAKFFIRNTPLKKGDIAPVLDFEEDGNLSASELRSRLIIWLELVEKHYKVKPIIYCNADFYKKYIRNKLDGYPIWVAHFKTKKPGIQKDGWHFWQYTEKGKIKGINGHVDLNVFNGTREQMEKILILH